MAKKQPPKKRNGSAKRAKAKYAQTAKAVDPYAPKGTDPILLCRKCGVWSARKNYCQNCLAPRAGFTKEGTR